MSKRSPKPLGYWLQRVEHLIAANTTAPRVRGKYKGHGSTDSCTWVAVLSNEVNADIRASNRGIGYDENLALASTLGVILSTWYALCHRAKAYDLNRPLTLRRKALKRCTDYRARLAISLSDDQLMAATWRGQLFNIPYGRGAIDGSFV